ncbi:MAG: peptidyl-prolyl cis-trans isomerase [Treponema sp.]|nr:peptidyl-prolyl cis-trans isomerase [Treponema sp.]MDY3886586.1 peptidyl-prolyl cis-trans isomerase [Treponema sp.]MDY5124207.1 peptidyl-prolyl cis-trans isomerase [Treponema sp.]
MKKKIVLSALIFLMTAGMAFAQADLQVLTVVKYNKSESITVRQLKQRVSTYEKQVGRPLSVDERKKVLDSLIDEKLMLQAATKAGVTIPDSAVDQYFMQNMSQQLGAPVSEQQLEDIIKQSQGSTLDELLVQQVGMNKAEYKAYLKNQLILQQYVVSKKQAEIQGVAPTDAEIRMFYEANKTSFVWNDMVKAFVIIVPKGNDPDAAKLKINDLRNQYADKKVTAEKLAKDSQKPDAGFQAGEMLLPKTNDTAMGIGMTYQNLLTIFDQKEGFVSDIQESPVDYRVFSVVKKYSAKMLTLSDVVQPETTVTVYDYIRSNLTQQKQLQYIQIAAKSLAEEINKPENVEFKKTGDALNALLKW